MQLPRGRLSAAPAAEVPVERGAVGAPCAVLGPPLLLLLPPSHAHPVQRGSTSRSPAAGVTPVASPARPTASLCGSSAKGHYFIIDTIQL